ncbi:secretin N-terminal domain-containing protein [Undibacterium sp. Ren11W]|uniref:secretin N-terminal domain-containing protein n=1 Tax=Undibacterium sp. Ren11W TaxID=3413045 RepID=UPI003BF11822
MKNFSFRLNGKTLMARLLPVSTVCAMSLLSGCAKIPLIVPQKLAFERSQQAVSATLVGEEQLQRKYSESDTPKMPPVRSSSGEKNGGKPAEALNEKSELSVSFDQMPLPTFIQAVYGGVIKTNYSMDAMVAARTDLVTFHTPRPQTASQMANLARMLLKSYGIAVQDFGGVIRIVPDSASSSYSPQIRRGRAQPDTPMSLRPVFHYVELEAIRVSDFSSLLRTMFGTKIQMQDDLGRNSILLSGQSDDISAAMEVIQVFDQPTMRGQRTKRISPVFWTADEFSKRLVEVLSAEGYAASVNIAAGTPILVLPIAPLNSVIIFSSSETILNHALKWAKELDKPSESQAGGAFFTYPVKNADAQALAKTLSELIGGGATTPVAAAGVAPSTSKLASKIVVNNATNSLIIKGGGPDEYRQWMALLAELDKPTKSALIDVMVAEVTAGTTDQLGVDWNFRAKTDGYIPGSVGTSNAGSKGLTFNFLNSAGLLRADINALATKKDAQILSSPKLMARNGETATIQVAQEVPILTGITTTPGSIITNPTTTNTVQYRTAGMILKVRPVINSGNRIDLDISQEVSDVQAAIVGGVPSPTIGIRKVETKLTLKDGSTVMLAGLISNNNNTSDSGVPLLKDIPGLGNLFKSQTDNRNKTELIILITPYIINDDFEAESITNAFQSSLGDWARDLKERTDLNRLKRVVPVLAISAVDNKTAPKLTVPDAVSTKTIEQAQPAINEIGQAQPAIEEVVPEKSEPDLGSDVVMSKPSVSEISPSAEVEKNSTSKKSVDKKNTSVPLIPSGSKAVTDSDLLEELKRAVQGK